MIANIIAGLTKNIDTESVVDVPRFVTVPSPDKAFKVICPNLPDNPNSDPFFDSLRSA